MIDDPNPDDIDARIEELRAQLAATQGDVAARDHTERASALAELGDLLLLRRGETDGDASTEDLEEAVAALESAHALVAPEPATAWLLAGALVDRWLLRPDPADLDRLIELFAEVATAPDLDPDDAAQARCRLAGALLDRDLPGDLDRAIAELESVAAARTAVADQTRAEALRLAGAGYAARFGRQARASDSDQAIRHWTGYVDMVRDPDPAVLIDLGSLLADRGDPARPRGLAVRALAGLPADDPMRARAHLVVAVVEWNAYQVTRDLLGLENATTAMAATVAAGVPEDQRENAETLRAAIVMERLVRGLTAEEPEPELMRRAAERMSAWLDNPGSGPIAPGAQVDPGLVAERRADLCRNHANAEPGSPVRVAWAYARVMMELQAVRDRPDDLDVPEVLTLLDEVEAGVRENAAMHQAVRMMQAKLYQLLQQRGDNRFVAKANEILADSGEFLADHPELRPLIEADDVAMFDSFGGSDFDLVNDPADIKLVRRAIAATADGTAALLANDRAAMQAAVDALQVIGDGVPKTSPVRRIIASCAAPLRMGLTPLAGRTALDWTVLVAMAALAWAGAALAVYDDPGSARAVEAAGAALAELPPDNLEAVRMRIHLAGAYLARIEQFRSFAEAGIIRELVEPAIERLTPDRPEWTLARGILARISEYGHDRAESVRLGNESLYGYAWRVLLASGTDEAAQIASGALDDARTAAQSCLQSRDADQAAYALDACRALVLLAAATSREVPDRLRAAGQAALADEWTAGLATGVPRHVRKRALEALATGASRTGGRDLLRPPAIKEIREALSTTGADALIYLAPLRKDNPPIAVVVPRESDCEIIRLDMRAERFSALTAFLSTNLSGRAAPAPSGKMREATAEDDPGPVDAATALADLGTWAWHAAMRELMGWCGRHGLAQPRLVLVPMAEYGLVPWHAARRPDGRYVVQDATISYAASARLLCDSAARAPMPAGSEGLIVGDPTGGLTHAGAEATAIHDALYPRMRYLGHRDSTQFDGAATVEEVVKWLRGTTQRPADLLHLACHGRVDTHASVRAYLELADGILSAEQLVELARTSPAGLRISIVVLAACSSGLSGRSYDEMYSLAHAFASSGARSVISSLWTVPDEETSVLMSAFHDFRQVGHLDPADALCEAQRWMLNPARARLPSMSDEIWSRAEGADLTAMVAWAGFTHTGQ